LIKFLILSFTAFIVSSPLLAVEVKNTSRVISLSPAITEIIFALGLEKKIVGVSEFSDFPSAAEKIPRVGPYSKPDLEKIYSMVPDLVFVAVEGPEDVLRHLEQMNISYQVLQMKTLSEIGDAAEIISTRLGDKEKGIEFKKKWDKDLKNIFPLRSEKRPSVLIEIQREPLIVAGNHTFLDEIVTKCGGSNIFHSLQGYPHVSTEAVITNKPKLILLADFFPDEKSHVRALNLWREIKILKNAKVEDLDPNTATRPGPRLLVGVRRICQILAGMP
jgi:iron complex transport system substrate-binding protein